MEIGDLPNEILEKIFLNLDGFSLTRSRATCRRWNELISSYQNDGRCSWRNICLREMDSDVLLEMLIYKSLGANFDQEFWRYTYITFHRSRHFTSYRRLVKKIPLPENLHRITCVKVTRDCIITGNACGNVWLWEASFGEVFQPLCKHQKPVTDIVLVDLFNLGRYKTVGCITAHHHVITSSTDRTIKITPLQLSKDGKEFSVQTINMPGPIHCLRIFDNILMAKGYDGSIYLWEMCVAAPTNTIMQLLALSIPEDNLPGGTWWAGLWEDELSIITTDVDRYTYNIKTKLWTSLSPPSLETVICNGYDILKNVVIKSCFLFHKQTIVFLTVNDYLGISVDGHHYKSYSTLDSLKSSVTSVKIYCNLFILGTSIGGVYVYLYEKKEDLLDLNLYKPLWSKCYLNSDIFSAIIAIDMWLNGKKIVLAAVTTDTIHVVQWLPKPLHSSLKAVL